MNTQLTTPNRKRLCFPFKGIPKCISFVVLLLSIIRPFAVIWLIISSSVNSVNRVSFGWSVSNYNYYAI